MKYKFLQKILGTVAIFSFGFLPLATFVFAAPGGSDTCTKAVKLQKTMNDKMVARMNELQNFVDENVKAIALLKNSNDKALIEGRDRWDKNADEHFAKLLERVATSTEEAAVKKFRDAVIAAKKTRRTKVDSAVKNFAQGVAQFGADRRQKEIELLERFETKVAVELENILKACEKNNYTPAARAAFVAVLESAGKEFRADYAKNSQNFSKLSTLTKKRKSDLDKAFTAYESALLKAFSDFKKSTEKNSAK